MFNIVITLNDSLLNPFNKILKIYEIKFITKKHLLISFRNIFYEKFDL